MLGSPRSVQTCRLPTLPLCLVGPGPPTPWRCSLRAQVLPTLRRSCLGELCSREPRGHPTGAADPPHCPRAFYSHLSFQNPLCVQSTPYLYSVVPVPRKAGGGARWGDTRPGPSSPAPRLTCLMSLGRHHHGPCRAAEPTFRPDPLLPGTPGYSQGPRGTASVLSTVPAALGGRTA